MGILHWANQVGSKIEADGRTVASSFSEIVASFPQADTVIINRTIASNGKVQFFVAIFRLSLRRYRETGIYVDLTTE